MQITVTRSSVPRLDKPSDFKQFDIALEPELRPDARRALSSIAELDDDADHAWVRPDAVRAISPLAGDQEWEQSFQAMIARADEIGCVKDGRIRAKLKDMDRPQPVTAEAFRSAMRRYASGVCVVAAGEGRERRGMTVSAFSSVSADPPMVLVCLNRSSSSHDALTMAHSFSVNMLSAEQEDVAQLFAGQKGLRDAERFEASMWQQSPLGAPVLKDAHQTVVCTAESRHMAGSHTVLFGRVIEVAAATDSTPALIIYDGRLCKTSARPITDLA